MECKINSHYSISLLFSHLIQLQCMQSADMLAEASRMPKKMVLDAARRIANSISIQLSMCLQQQQQQRHMLASHSVSPPPNLSVCLSGWLAM